jgi:fatty-acyl-CoA synthase
MDGLMMDRPLLIRDIAERVERIFPDREIVSRTHDAVERSTYGEVVRRARRVASSLERLGVKPGDRVATFGWNSRRHLELYLALPSMGAVMHTLNIRLFEEELRYIVGHAKDRVIFLDASLADVMPRFEGVEHECSCPTPDAPARARSDYEQLVEDGDEGFAFPDLDERTAAALCYTSGTTGKPKGVLYSHRSTVLHSLGANQADAFGLSEHDSVLPVVPMFHANAWGCRTRRRPPARGSWSPGPRMTPGDIGELIAAEQVTFTAGVPTIWLGMMRLDPAPDLSSLKEIVLRRLGRARVADPRLRGQVRRADRPGVGHDRDEPARVGRAPRAAAPGRDERFRLRATQGRVVPLVDFTIDEESGGELLVRGPWVASAYYEDDSQRRASRAAGCAPATSRARRRRLHQARRPHEGPREVRRRVDLVGRARERRDGPPEGDGGGGRRRARRQVGRAPVRVRGPRARARTSTPTSCAPSSPSGSRSGGSRTGSSSSTRCRRPRSASSTRRCCASGSRRRRGREGELSARQSNRSSRSFAQRGSGAAS